VEIGILRRRVASEKPLASTTMANIISECDGPSSTISIMERLFPVLPPKKYGALDYLLRVVIHDRSSKW
jgi:hypothetical protein